MAGFVDACLLVLVMTGKLAGNVTGLGSVMYATVTSCTIAVTTTNHY